ncbi:MAG: hypothetical protein ACJ77E_06280 [Gaiellaceae bacterium]
MASRHERLSEQERARALEREPPDAGRRGELEAARPASQLRAGPAATGQLLLSLQQQAGNRAVSGFVRSHRDESRLVPSPAVTPVRRAVIQRELKDKAVQAYGKQLRAKTGLPATSLVKLIKEKLTAKGDAVTVEHVTQILNEIGVSVPKNLGVLVAGGSTVVTLPAFTARFHHEAGGGVDGYATAIAKVTEAQRTETPELIAALNAGNMFAQHDGSRVRYDSQNAGKATSNFQIQLGGKDLYIPKLSAKDKTSISGVVVDDSIIDICVQSPAVAAYVLGQMKTAHSNSYADGNKRVLTLDAEG